MADQEENVEWDMHVSGAELWAALKAAVFTDTSFLTQLANNTTFCNALASSSAWKAANTTNGPSASLPSQIAATTLAQGLSR